MSKANSGAKWWLVGTIGLFLIIFGISAGPLMCAEEAVEAFDYNGEVEEIHLVQTDGLQGLIIGEDVREGYGDGTLQAKKLSVFDLNDGRRVSVLTAGDETKCPMLAGDLLWCFDEELGLHGRDPVNLKPVWDQSALHGTSPTLRGRVRKRSEDFDYEETTGRILIKTDQGYYYYLNAKDRSLQEAPDDANLSSTSYYPTRSNAQLPSGKRLALTGNERKHIQCGEDSSDASFLKGAFLADRLTGQVLLLPGPEPDMVIAHWRRLDDSDSGEDLLLSRVTPAGVTVWQVDVEALFTRPDENDTSRQIKVAYLTPQGLLVLYNLANRGKLLMLDPATGAVRWKREL